MIGLATTEGHCPQQYCCQQQAIDSGLSIKYKKNHIAGKQAIGRTR